MIDQDKIRALIKTLRKYTGTGFVVDDVHAAADTIDLLLAEVEAAAVDKRDAERYRWLKNNSNVQFDYPVQYPIGFGKETIWSSMPARLEMDRAIDAALAQRQGEGS